MVEYRHCPKLFLLMECMESLVPAVSTLLEMTNWDVSTTDCGLSTRTAIEINPMLAAQRSLHNAHTGTGRAHSLPSPDLYPNCRGRSEVDRSSLGELSWKKMVDI